MLPRFSLRTWLILAPLCGLGTGAAIQGCGLYDAIWAVRLAGGHSIEWRWTGITSVSFYDTMLTDADLRRIGPHLRSLEGIDVSGTRITDESCRLLAELGTVSHIRADWTNISAAGLTALERLPRLQSLSLRNVAVDDNGLAALTRIETLRNLTITSRDCTPEAFAAFAESAELKSISLGAVFRSDTFAVGRLGVTFDDYLRALASSTTVDVIRFDGTLASEAGFAELCKIKTLKRVVLEGRELNPSHSGLALIKRLRPDISVGP